MNIPLSSLTSALNELRTLLGPKSVLDSAEAALAYGADTDTGHSPPVAAVRIASASELPTVMDIATRHRVAVYPVSTGRNWGYGSSLPTRAGALLIDLSGLQKIIHFDATLGVVTVEPGVTQGMLCDFLERGGHPFMVPVTGAGPGCSLVGNALERGFGVTPHADHFSAVTDLEAVLADGSVYRTALREAGGEDLARLFKWGIGSYTQGLFTQAGVGIVTRMSIILARRPQCVRVCLFSLKRADLLEPTVARIQTVLARLPGIVGGINLMNQHRVLAMAAPYPAASLDAGGLIRDDAMAELGRRYHIFPWTAFGTLYGTDRMVAAARKEIKAELAGIATRLVFLSPRQAAMMAAAARRIPGVKGRMLGNTARMLSLALELAAGRPNETALPLAYWRSGREAPASNCNPARDGCGLLWYAPLVPMRPVAVRAFTDMVTRITRRNGIEPLITLTSMNDRLFDATVPLLFDRDDPKQVANAHRCYSELLQEGRANGWFPYRVGVAAMDDLREVMGSAAGFNQRIHKALDPHDLIAPGRYR